MSMESMRRRIVLERFKKKTILDVPGCIQVFVSQKMVKSSLQVANSAPRSGLSLLWELRHAFADLSMVPGMRAHTSSRLGGRNTVVAAWAISSMFLEAGTA